MCDVAAMARLGCWAPWQHLTDADGLELLCSALLRLASWTEHHSAAGLRCDQMDIKRCMWPSQAFCGCVQDSHRGVWRAYSRCAPSLLLLRELSLALEVAAVSPQSCVMSGGSTMMLPAPAHGCCCFAPPRDLPCVPAAGMLCMHACSCTFAYGNAGLWWERWSTGCSPA